jgi:Ca2+-binding RTX toxin-like protein
MSTISVTGDYIVGPAQDVSFTDDDPAYLFTAGLGFTDPTFTDQGSIEVASTLASASISAFAADTSSTFANSSILIASGASVTVNATGAASYATGLATTFSPVFENNGLFSVSAVENAIGVQQPSQTYFKNTGTFSVSASDPSSIAVGLSNGSTGAFDNAGTFSVSGGQTAIGADFASNFIKQPLVNTGSLTVVAASGDSTGFLIDGVAAGSIPSEIDNSGTITATKAISSGAGDALILKLVNSGTVNGDIDLGNGLNPSFYAPGSVPGSQILNSGAIHGAVHLDVNGNDLYDGRGGTQTGGVYLGGGTETVYLGADGETVYGGAGAAHLTGGSGADTFVGGAGNDFVDGGGGDDVLDGGGGTNTLSFASAGGGVTVSLALQAPQATGVGTDTLSNFQNLTGSAFNDTLEGDGNNNVLDGGAGTNTLSYAHAASGVTVSLARQGSAQNTVGAGTDTLVDFQALTGSSFNDVLEGGGPAASVLTGGLGADTFVYSQGDGAVTITDFSDAQGDRIDVRLLYGFTTLSQVLANATQQGADTVISFGGGDSLTLQNVAATSLLVSDFLFGSTPIQVGNTTVVIDPNASVSVASDSLVQFTDPAGGTLINKGTMTLNSTGSPVTAGVITAVQPETDAVFENDGTFSVTSPLGIGVSSATVHNNGTFNVSAGVNGGEGATGDFVNAGRVNVQGSSALGTPVYGDYDSAGELFQNQANATFLVSASTAVGVEMTNGGQFINAGMLEVSAGNTGTGVIIDIAGAATSIVNSGWISAGGVYDTGVVINNNSPTAAVSLQNSGVIVALTAISASGYGVSLDNSGLLNGNVTLENGDNHVVNTGSINGGVTLGNGDNTLDSHLGSISGPITLGSGSDTLILGANSDVILGAGTHVVTASSEFNSVSYANAAAGVTVSLAAQGQTQFTGVGTDTLSNFQALTGSAYNDNLTAGNGASTVYGGTGADTFSIPAGATAAIVADFSHAQGDRIDLSAFSQFSSMAVVLGAATQSGASTVISTGSGSITLWGVQASTLTAADFILAAGGGGSPAEGLQINITYDSSVDTAPADFKAAVQAAVQFFQTTFDSNASVNINIGWGEFDGQALDSGALGESSSSYVDGLTYAQVQRALAIADANSPVESTAVAGLPIFNPLPGDGVALTTAEAKALGLYNGEPSNLDGYVGLSSSSTFAFDPNHRAAAGAFDAVGVIEHEISEVLGRVVLASDQNDYGPLDLFRYAGPSAHQFWSGPGSYFSLDGGVTSLKTFNNGTNGSDSGDWASNAQVDAFDAFATLGAEADVSPVDISMMQLLGYSVAPTAAVIGTSANNFSASFQGVYRQYTVGAGGATVIGGPENANDSLTNIHRIQFVDGYLAVSPTDTAGQVYRVYEATLGRAPDQEGLTNWVQELNGGATLQSVVDGFVNSTEFQADYGANLGNSQFVTLLYENVLHREPDQSGLDNWVAGLNGGETRAQVVLGFSESQEDIGDLAAPVQHGLWIADPAAGEVARLYDTVLGRLPDGSGLANWTHTLEGGASLQSVADGFVGSQEFQADYGALNNNDFVTLLYHNVLHRDPDPGGLANWVGDLNGGMTRAQVVVGFSESPEHIGNMAPYIDDGVWLA